MYKVLGLVFMALAAAGCGCPHVDGVHQQGTSPAFHTDIALQVMQEQVPCPLQLSGDIVWYDSPLGAIELACWQPAMGCADPYYCSFTVWISTVYPPSGPDILPVWRTALVNEIGYWVWYQCYGFIGESYVNGKEVLDPGLSAWISSVNAETAARAALL